jgi:SEC-C motif-containing protein
MRSRYTAYVQRNAAYLYSSWHPDTRSARQDIAATPTVNWLDLSIVAVEAGGVNDQQGWVEFQARYRDNGVVQVLQERSCFLRHNGHWVYHSGEIKRAALPGVGRNAPCPCGSGKKFKRCCGR